MPNLALFFGVCLLSTAIPGPAVLYVSSQGVAGGMRSAVPSSLGILAADTFYIILSMTGLTTVLIASYGLFTVIRWMGAIYLVYLGLRLVWAGVAPSAAAPSPAVAAPGASAPSKALLGGFVLHAANPKALLYFGSLVPQFLNPERPLWLQLITLALVHLATASAVLLACSVISSRFRRSAAGARLRRAFNVGAGTFLVGAGASLALARNAAR